LPGCVGTAAGGKGRRTGGCPAAAGVPVYFGW